jgi:pseudouridine-5'-phosphate glycosidase
MEGKSFLRISISIGRVHNELPCFFCRNSTSPEKMRIDASMY